jgi:hypothetical protein
LIAREAGMVSLGHVRQRQLIKVATFKEK